MLPSLNRLAFLATIAHSEGTFDKGDRGYNVMFGGKLFGSYEDHPRTKIYIPRLEIYTSAAGRYQINEPTFDAVSRKLKIEGFQPEVQDAMAIYLIQQRNALPMVDTGNFDAAILLCSKVWASFPGAGYGQPENKLSDLRSFFLEQSGTLSAETTNA